MRSIGALGTEVELRPSRRDATDAAGVLSSWSRSALSFVAIATAAAALSNPAEANISSVQQQAVKAARVAAPPHQDSPVMAALVQHAVTALSQKAAATAMPAWSPVLPDVMVRIEGKDMPAMHPFDRVRLCQVVAKQHKLSAVGRDWKDIYAIINAETAWAAREGKGRSGTPSYGLAQLELRTARALNIEDPNDPQQALSATARLITESVGWARARGIEMKDAAISVNYNLSSAARNAWSGTSLEDLPIETQRHVKNVSQGRQIADVLGRQTLVFEKALDREISAQRASVSTLGYATGSAASDSVFRSAENEARVRSAEDEGRVKAKAALANAADPFLGESIQMTAAGLAEFKTRIGTLLRTGVGQRPGVAAPIKPPSPPSAQSRERFAVSFPTLVGFLGDQINAVSAYAENVRSTYAVAVSKSVGGAAEIELTTHRRARAQSALLVHGGAAHRDALQSSTAVPLDAWITKLAASETDRESNSPRERMR